MDPITSQMTANPVAMANPTGGMQQMPVGPVPGGQVPVGYTDGMNRMAPPMPPRGPMNIQGALSQFQQSPMYQNNPMLQQMVAQMQGNSLYQQLQQNPMYQGIFGQQNAMQGGTLDQTHPRMLGPRPPMSQPMMPPQFGQNRFAEMQQRMMAMQPPQFGMRRHGDEQRDQYGNPIAAPVLYDRQMPELMQRYGMM